MQMKILITGINGFVGTHLKKLLEEKSYDVYGIDKNSDKEDIFKADITDNKKVFDIIKKVKPEKIFHLAAQSSATKSFKFPKLTERVIVHGTKNIINACINSKISPKILIVSSSEVYGNQTKFPINEDSELKPLNPYAVFRIKQEELCINYFKNHGIKVVITRSFNHTGPGQNPSFICPHFARQIALIENGMKEPVIEAGNLNTSRDFTDVRDIVVAYDLALEKCRFGEIYNICSSKAYKNVDLLNTLLKMSKIKVKIKIDKNRIRGIDMPFVQGDNTKFCKETDWKPKISIQQTLKDILEYWRHRVKE